MSYQSAPMRLEALPVLTWTKSQRSLSQAGRGGEISPQVILNPAPPDQPVGKLRLANGCDRHSLTPILRERPVASLDDIGEQAPINSSNYAITPSRKCCLHQHLEVLKLLVQIQKI